MQSTRKCEHEGALTFVSVITRLLASVVVTGTATVVVIEGGGCSYEVGPIVGVGLNTPV